MARSLIDRLLPKFEIGDDCWEWTAGQDGKGYGQFFVDGHHRGAHRVVYETFVGPIPEGHQIDHLCRNPLCVNPDHLEPVTKRENLLRGNTVSARSAVATHCPKGHPYDDTNTRYTRKGHRRCIVCDKEFCRVGHLKRKARRA